MKGVVPIIKSNANKNSNKYNDQGLDLLEILRH